MDKAVILREISEIIPMQESAISNHPERLQAVYRNTKNTILAGQHKTWLSETDVPFSLSDQESSLINQYITSSSFITAWYHLAGDKGRRNKLTNSCTTLISSLGPLDTEVLTKYIETERLCRSSIKSYGAAPKNFGLLKFFIVVALIAAGAYFLFGN